MIVCDSSNELFKYICTEGDDFLLQSEEKEKTKVDIIQI